jgi:photosystem II stability/assembly factor-like uncharacterized protein
MNTLLKTICIALCVYTTGLSQWLQTSGPEGGAAFAIFADGSNLYAGMAGNAGVFRSTDGGATWEQKINGMNYQSTTVISKSGSYLLATGTVGLYRSTDNGDTWVAATGLPPGHGVNSLAVDGANVIAGTSGKGIYVSTDNGDTWTPASTGLPGAGANTTVGNVIINGSTILTSASDFGTTTTMYRSTNFGASWTAAATGLPADYSLYYGMCIDGSTIYAGGAYLYKTTNNGDTWTPAENGIPNYSSIMSVSANGTSIFAAAMNYIYRTTDGGSNWSPATGGLPFMNFMSVRIAGSTVYAGSIANGIYSSTDNGVTWTQKVTGLKARDMSGFIIDGATLYANGNSIFKTSDNGDTWENVRGNLKDSSSMPTLVYINGSTMFERDFPATSLERSTDGGATWTVVGNGLSPFGTVTGIVDVPGGLLTVSSRVYKSIDNGDNWVQVDSSLGLFVSFSALTKIGSTIYAYGMGIAKSTDDGTTWVRADSGLPAFYSPSTLVGNGSGLYVSSGFTSGIYRSTNDGQSWSLWTSGAYSQLLIHGNDLFGCRDNDGVFIRKNFAGTFTRISTGLPTPNFRYTFAIHNGWMFVGTGGNSVWRRPLSDVTAVEEIAGTLPTKFMLSQNYPNPFNPMTNFELRIADFGFVTLQVYDVLGREVTSLVNETLQPGTYKVSWDAGNQTSGVYYYKLQAGSYSETKKMLLVK